MHISNVGIIVNTHGLKGELKIKLLSDFPALRFAKGGKLYFNSEQGEKELMVHSARLQKDCMMVVFEGLEDINLVESLKGTLLYIHEDQQQPLSQDEAYFHEIMNSKAYDTNQVYIGSVSEIIETGANIILRISDKDKEHLIPFVKAFVVDFDKENKIMHIEMMEGL